MSLVQILHFNEKEPVTVFQLLERITLDNFAQLETVTRDACDHGMSNLVLDLSQIPILSSIGVRGIVVIHKMVSINKGNSLKLAAAQPRIQDVLQIAGITQFIDLYDTVEEAVASF